MVWSVHMCWSRGGPLVGQWRGFMALWLLWGYWWGCICDRAGKSLDEIRQILVVYWRGLLFHFQLNSCISTGMKWKEWKNGRSSSNGLGLGGCSEDLGLYSNCDGKQLEVISKGRTLSKCLSKDHPDWGMGKKKKKRTIQESHEGGFWLQWMRPNIRLILNSREYCWYFKLGE